MSADDCPALQVRGVTKRFTSVVANDAVDLSVERGEVVGLLGHNGAGKTTLVSQIVGLLKPDAGSIRVGKLDAVAHPASARQLVGLQPQAQAPIEGLTPREAITLTARIRGLSRREARQQAERLAEILDITAWLDVRALPDGAGVSGGVRRLTSFAMAAIAPAPLVILDEPTNDVDPARRRRLWGLVRALADDGAGVLLVTHNVVEAERVVDQVAILDHGKIVAAGTPAQVRGADDSYLRLELTLPPGKNGAGDLAPPFPTIRCTQTGRRLLLTLATAHVGEAVAWSVDRRNAEQIEAYALTPTSLEDTYLALTEPMPDAPELSDV